MRFGPVGLEEARGAILAHALRAGDRLLKKGTRIGADEIAALEAAGVAELVVARPDPGDLLEDEAAERIAHAAAGGAVRVEAPFTGRSNLYATADGLLAVDAAAVHAVNAVDETLTIATLPPMKPVVAGEMVGTVKIIPFAVAGALVEEAAGRATGAIRVAPFRRLSVAVVSTLLPSLKASVVDKTLDVLRRRLAPLAGSEVVADLRVPHAAEAIGAALRELPPCDLVLVFGASAVSDRRDVVPAGIEAAGGTVEHLGMPVDPGNLLVLARLGETPVLGAPGCARSPRENGFDWVLQRIAAGIAPRPADIQAMGVGGLLMEIVSRPQPRAPQTAGHDGPVAAIVMAAGRSSRMGRNKLIERVDGRAMVAHAVAAARGAGASPVIVVTGHEAERVAAELAGEAVELVHNPAFAEGMATSLQAGLAAVPAACGGALVLLGDMPRVGAATASALVEAWRADPSCQAVVPLREGRRGNPVLIGRPLFAEIARQEGDVGARAVLAQAGPLVREVVIGDDAVLFDVDTPEALALARGLPVS